MEKSFTHTSLALLGIRDEGLRHKQYGEQVILPAGETHEGWYFAAGDRVLIQGTVNGDAYVAGGEVQVEGTINGDLLVAGGQVTISGEVTDDVRAAGGMVSLEGTVGKNATVAGGALKVGRKGVIEGGLLAAGGNVDLSGQIRKEVRVTSGEMTLTGKVDGNVIFAGKRLSVIKGAQVGGNLHARVENKDLATIADGTVSGTTEITPHELKPEARILGHRVWRFWAKVLWLLSLLLTALVCTFVFPKHLPAVGTAILQRPGRSALWGVVAVVLIPVVILLLVVIVIGLPLGLLLLVMFLWLLYLSQLTLGVALGKRFFVKEPRTPGKAFIAFALGIVIVQILTFIPYVRFFVTLAGVIFGVGAILLVLWDEFRAQRTAGI
jgi:cytoskeletal protein CcmA (bactofilin family)